MTIQDYVSKYFVDESEDFDIQRAYLSQNYNYYIVSGSIWDKVGNVRPFNLRLPVDDVRGDEYV